MPLSLTDFADGDVIDAAELMSAVQAIEDHINGGIIDSDVRTSAWVKSSHLGRTSFYGAPAPRANGVTFDVHWRGTSSDMRSRVYLHPDVSTKYTPIRGLCATIKVPEDNTPCNVLCTFYTFEFGGAEILSGLNPYDTVECANFMLFVDGVAQESTLRPLFTMTEANFIFTRKQHSISIPIQLDKGVHDIGVYCSVTARGAGGAPSDSWLHIFVDAKSLVLDVMVR